MRPQYRSAAQLCYSGAIRANPRDCYEARMGKAALLREIDNTPQAITEYRRILDDRPHDTTILRFLAECYIDRDDVATAKGLYQQSIAFYQTADNYSTSAFGWSDVNIYLELLEYLGQYQDAISELKSLSRWILGRKNEEYWDFVSDDREWDADSVRRLQIPGFTGNELDINLYGLGLPLELRVKLGIYRLRLGQIEESLVRFPRLALLGFFSLLYGSLIYHGLIQTISRNKERFLIIQTYSLRPQITFGKQDCIAML